jgi:hypothetical protein
MLYRETTLEVPLSIHLSYCNKTPHLSQLSGCLSKSRHQSNTLFVPSRVFQKDYQLVLFYHSLRVIIVQISDNLPSFMQELGSEVESQPLSDKLVFINLEMNNNTLQRKKGSEIIFVPV